MIARHEAAADNQDVWARLAAPLPREEIQWRIDGKPKRSDRDHKFYARQVAWADVPAVVHRLDSVVPGQWSFTAEVIGACTTRDNEKGVAIKGSMTILGVTREDVGVDTDEKAALSDAFKRTARLFGIALELWTFPQSYVETDGDGKFAKIVGDSWEAHDYALQKHGRALEPSSANGNGKRKAAAPRSADLPALPAWPELEGSTDRESSVGLAARIKQLIEVGKVPESLQAKIRKSLVAKAGDIANMQRIVAGLEEQYFMSASKQPSLEQDAAIADYTANADGATPAAAERAASHDVPPCPNCGGKMWDNRIGKKNPKAPDFKCRDRSCGGVIWPPKKGKVDDTLPPDPGPVDEIPF